MYLFNLFKSFLPMHNPVGFGAADFILLTLAALFTLFAVGWRWTEPCAAGFARRTVWCMLFLAVLPVALRLALLPHHPVPVPDIYDEFSHLLAADTLRHFRLANPAHAMHRFFETFFVLQQPTYSSIYPIGQGLSMALGRMLFGHPWAGVLLSAAAFCSLCYWMLRGWTTPGWALVGGMLAVIELGPLSLWMNCYWGGAFAAAGGCLVFGALPRLRSSAGYRNAVLLGAGLAIDLLTRPYESVFLCLGVVLFFAPALWKREALPQLARAAAVAALVVMPAIGVTLLQNKQVTGSWTTLPYTLSRYQYGVPMTFTFQANAEPHLELTPQQALDYKMQRAYHGEAADTLGTYLERLEYRVRYYRFFFLPPLYLALAAFVVRLREYRFAWAAATLALFALATNFFPLFEVHYLAPVACLFVLTSVAGLEQLGRLSVRGSPAGLEACRLILFLCAAQFLFWYAMHVLEGQDFSESMRKYETWDAVNHDRSAYRTLIAGALAQAPGEQLVFVRYYPQHIFQNEWVWNEADIDAARVVYARDLGPAEDEKLRQYYPGRTAWLLEPDFRPPRLRPYPSEPPPPPAAASPFEPMVR